MKRAAEVGVGIEINSCSMMYTPEEEGDILRIYRIAKECGCKFYCGSDAHHPEKFKIVKAIFENAVHLLNLTEYHKFVLQ